MSIITWLADHLFAARTRAAEVRREITEHDASAAQIQTDLVGWTSDHARKVETEMRKTKNEAAGRGHLYSGAMRNGLEHVMERAQEARPNAASEKVRAFKALARRADASESRSLFVQSTAPAKAGADFRSRVGSSNPRCCDPCSAQVVNDAVSKWRARSS